MIFPNELFFLVCLLSGISNGEERTVKKSRISFHPDSDAVIFGGSNNNDDYKQSEFNEEPGTGRVIQTTPKSRKQKQKRIERLKNECIDKERMICDTISIAKLSRYCDILPRAFEMIKNDFPFSGPVPVWWRPTVLWPGNPRSLSLGGVVRCQHDHARSGVSTQPVLLGAHGQIREPVWEAGIGPSMQAGSCPQSGYLRARWANGLGAHHSVGKTKNLKN